ncbi:Hint domain-containing protein, partial [Microvirga massiliensis]|uniref:Hint domain-containing protein n=1 Tax=Microvirga massiliensis TaxID=1033741 RepID=UPI00062B7387
PEHALFIDGVLIPVRELVNGISIVPALPEGTEVIEYFQILLDSHEVILAEGAPIETYLLRGRDYESFTNFIEYERLYGHEPRPALTPFAPLVSYNGGRAHLKALLLLGMSPFVQVRDPVGSAYERLATRADELVR